MNRSKTTNRPNKVKKLFRYATDKNYRFLINAGFHMYDKMPDEEYLKRKYKAIFGKELDLERPVTFNEKLQWLKLNDRKPEYTTYVDKYAVRQYIAQKLGEEYLIPLLGVWDKPEDIDFDALPDQFVLKCNHNSGLGMCICRDKSKLDKKKTINELKKGLAQNYYLSGREWPYKNVKPRIIAEKYMEEDDGSDLKDYKIHCFNGEPRFILVCSDRFSSAGLREDFYDTDWNRMDIRRPKHPNSESGIAKPNQLEDMLNKAKTLSNGTAFSRIDLYVIRSRIYFGEITFFPASGFEPFEPEDADTTLGSWIHLPQKKGGC